MATKDPLSKKDRAEANAALGRLGESLGLQHAETLIGSEQPRTLAQESAARASEKIERLAAEVEASADGEPSHATRAATVEALKDLNVAMGCKLPGGGCRVGAAAQAGVIKNVTRLDVIALRKNAAAWRAYADGTG